ncbi:MAG: hypothetical protein ACOCZE_05135, partial [Planctomycetota bacterium]
MRKTAALCMVAVVAGLTAIASGQLVGGAIPGGVARVSPAVGLIPSDAAGFVVINDLEKTLSTLDKFLADIGMDQQVPAPLMQMLKSAGGLGEGFQPKNGVAIAMLNFKKHNYDVVGMMEGRADSEEMPPIVVYMPGNSVKGIMPNAQTSREGKYLKVTLPEKSEEPMYALESKGYVLVSPKTSYLDDAAAVNKAILGDLTFKSTALASRSLVFARANMDVIGPVYIKMIEKSMQDMQQMGRMGGGPEAMFINMMAPMLKGYTNLAKDMVSEMTSVEAGMRISEKNMVIEELVGFRAGGKLSQMAATRQVAASELVQQLPGQKWFLAVGQMASQGEGNDVAMKMMSDMIKKLEEAELPFALPANTSQRLTSMLETASEQIESFQMVMGGAAEGNGVFGTSCVLDVKSADKLKSVMAAKAAWLNDLVQANAQNDPNLQPLKISYEKNVTTIQGVSVDAIVIDHPALAQMPQQARDQIKMVLGETKVHFFVAAPSVRQVAISFGGGTEGITAALAAARRGGSIHRDKGVQDVL